MSMKQLIEEHISSSDHLSKKHVHPKLAKLFELGGLNTVFERGEGQYLWDGDGNKYLDFLGGGGVFLLGRNHPKVNAAIKDVIEMDWLPNLCVVNSSVLGGVLAEKLIEKAGPDHYGKVLLANSGTEATDMAIRFARFVTGRRRFLYLEGAFHGRTYAAASVCGSAALRDGMEPLMPTCTPIPANDLAALRRELRKGDVAGFIFEPLQGMTLEAMDPGYMREAQSLCEKYGTILMADEVQTGLCRTGDWFRTSAHGIRPGLMWVSKILSGGQACVSAVLMSDELYERIFAKFKAGPIYFSTFAENNISMAAGIATIQALEEMDAPKRARELGALLRAGVEKLREEYDVIEGVKGEGLMMGVFFKPSDQLGLRLQHAAMDMAEKGSFGAAVNVDMYAKYRVICQIPGPGLDAIKILPPAVSTEEDVQTFLSALEETLHGYYTEAGPIRSISRGFVQQAVKDMSSILPGPFGGMLRSVASGGSLRGGDEPKKKSTSPAPELTSSAPSNGAAGRAEIPANPKKPLMEFGDYVDDIHDHADFVVVGSGPGGSMVARALAAEGKSVIVVEAGQVLRPGGFTRDVGETLAKYFWDGGLRTMRGNIMAPSLVGKALGGGSVFNSAICLRMPEWQAERWRDEHGIERIQPDDLVADFDFIEDFLQIEPTPTDVLGRRSELFRDGGTAMGYEPHPIARNVQGCRGSAQCLNGCNNGAKLSNDRRGIPEAIENGARVYTSVHVDRLIMRGDRAAGIIGHTVNPENGRKGHSVRITAGATILAAGAFASPVLMMKSGLRRPAIGKNLRCHPGVVLLGHYDEEVNPWSGATQGYHITKFLPQGIKMETVWTASAIFAQTFKGLGGSFKDRIHEMKHMASWDAWASGDDSNGEVRLLPRGQVDYRFDLGVPDMRRIVEGSAKLAEMFFASGAKQVYTPLGAPFNILYGPDDIKELRQAKFEPSDMVTGSNHIFGTTRMGGDENQYVCDSNGAVYGTEDLFVCDTGLFPTTPGVNPMMTLWAFANRMGRELAVWY